MSKKSNTVIISSAVGSLKPMPRLMEAFEKSDFATSVISGLSRNQLKDLIAEQPELIDLLLIDCQGFPSWFANRQIKDAMNIAHTFHESRPSTPVGLITLLDAEQQAELVELVPLDKPCSKDKPLFALNRATDPINYDRDDPLRQPKTLEYSSIAERIADTIRASQEEPLQRLQALFESGSQTDDETVRAVLQNYENRSSMRYFMRRPLAYTSEVFVETWASSQKHEVEGSGVF